ncbi:helix-turn-helix domain-containing protein, partial [Agromyces sp. NPDC058136]|uniref:helix-turn-helix domain-containing protein n=1 Tax=Agromyces sp. NPDC058136 TaxID=3346354 RepID=UPI0036DCD17E
MSINRATAAPTSANEIIGENVHQLIWRSRSTQKDIAPVLGITQSALSHKLRGARPWYPDEIVAVAGFFGVGVGELFTQGGPAGGWASLGSDSPRSTV